MAGRSSKTKLAKMLQRRPHFAATAPDHNSRSRRRSGPRIVMVGVPTRPRADRAQRKRRDANETREAGGIHPRRTMED